MHRLLFRRWVICGLFLGAIVLAGGLTGCGINFPKPMTEVVAPPTVPTNTLPPVITQTLRFTATPIPTSTLIPTNTLPVTETSIPQPPTQTPQPIATTAVRGAVNLDATTVNLRDGPSTDARTLRTVSAGTQLTVLGVSPDREWYFVALESGVEGWMASEFVTVTNPTAVAVVSSAELTARAQQAATRPVVQSGTIPPTLRPRINGQNDVLAYCDLPDYRRAEAGKSFNTTTAVSIYWNWFAKEPEQIQDHLDYGDYEVSVEVKNSDSWTAFRKLDDYRNYRTATTRRGGDWYVYWFYPLGPLPKGEYRVSYKLTWRQRVEDGYKSFGPGGDEQQNTGTCLFTVK